MNNLFEGEVKELFGFMVIMIIIQITLGRGDFWRAADNLPAKRPLLEGLHKKVMIIPTGEVVVREVLEKQKREQVCHKGKPGSSEI